MSYFEDHPRARKAAIRAGIAGAIITLLLVLLPIGVAWFGERWLQDNGAASASIEDVDINLFTGVVRVSGLQASGSDTERLNVGVAELDMQWWPLASKRVRVRSLRLEETAIDIRQLESGWQIGAVVIPLAPSQPAEAEPTLEIDSSDPWGIGSDIIRVANVQVRYHDPVFDTDVDVREIYLGSHYSWDAGEESEVRVDVVVNGSPLAVGGTVQPWAERRGFDGSLETSELTLDSFSEALGELAGLSEPEGAIDLDLELQAFITDDGLFDLRITGPLSINGTSFSVAGVDVAQESLSWDGQIDLRLPASIETPLVQIQGEVTATGANVTATDYRADARLGTFSWKGDVEFTPSLAPEEAPVLRSTGELTLNDFALGQIDVPGVLMAFQTLSVPEIEVTGLTSARVPTINLSGLRGFAALSESEDETAASDVMRVDEVQVSGISVEPGAIAVESIAIAEPAFAVTRNADGDLERITPALAAIQEVMPEGSESEEATEAISDEGDESEPFNVTVANMQINSTNLLRFVDSAVEPPARFQLTTFNSRARGFDLSGGAPTEIEMELGDGNMSLGVNGTVNAFAQPQSANLIATLRALDLSQISTYLPAYNIERGRLNSDSTITINGDQINAQNDLLIERLKLSGKAGGESDLLGEGLAMPLDVALDLLRNNDDEIELALPVTGSLSAPEFGTGDVLRLAMQKALQRAALSYAKNALQPLGTILFVSNLASQATRPRFEPVELPPGEAILPSRAAEYLKKVGELLTSRPGIAITVCGVAVPADRAAMLEVKSPKAMDDTAVSPATSEAVEVTDAEMLELAGERTSAVIGFLTETQGVDAGRLFTCRETIESDEDATPRTEIYL